MCARIVAFLMICQAVALAAAQEKSADTVELDKMVITASKQPRSVGNVTQKIDILEEEELQQGVSGKSNLAEAIAHKPGSSVSVLSRNDPNWGTYGGIGPKYSTWMINGLPINSFVDPMGLDVNAVERIEIQRGPSSVMYPNYLTYDFAGVQSPLAGTVNLILRDRIEKPATNIATSYGSYNTLNGQLYHHNAVNRFNYFTGCSYERSDYTDYGTEDSWLNMQDNPEYRKTKVFGGTSLFFGESEEQNVSFFFNRANHKGDAGRVYRGFNHNYGIINAGYRVAFNQDIRLQSNLGYRSVDRTWQESSFGVIDTLKSNNGVFQAIIPFDISLSYAHFGNSLLTIGGDYQGADYQTWNDPLNGYRTYGNKSTAMQGGIYIQEEFAYKGLSLRSGIRYSYTFNHIDLIGGGAPGLSEKRWHKALWSAGARYTIIPQVAVFANGGSSFLTPSLKSIGGTIKLSDLGVAGKNGQLPNPDLKPESGIGIDAGADVSLPASFAVSLRWFDYMVNDAIVENRVSENPSQSQSVNAGKTTSMGGEIELSQKIESMLRWYLNYTFMNTEIENKKDADQDGASVPFAPMHIANAGVTFTAPFGLRISPSLNYNAGYYDSSSKTVRKRFVPGALFNASVSQRISASEKYAVECFGSFYNIADRKFEMPWQFQDPGFSAMGGVRVTF